MPTVLDVDFVLTLAKLGVLAYILAVYLRLYRQMHQPFTLGLLVFAGLFFLQSLGLAARFVWSYFHPDAHRMFDHGGDEQLVYLRLIPSVLELAAFIVVARLARK